MVHIKAFLVYLLIICGYSIIINTQSESQHLLIQNQGKNLGFPNRTGSNTPKAYLTSFINYVNSASSFFRNETEARLSYISDRMNAEYGSSLYGFSVFQMSNESKFDWALNNDAIVSIYASFAPGIDRLFPQNSYLFVYEFLSINRPYVHVIGQKGAFVSQKLENFITSTIISIETTQTCQCEQGTSQKIRDLVKEFDQSHWNVFCSASYTFQAVLYPQSSYYIYVRPKNCYYLLYSAGS